MKIGEIWKYNSEQDSDPDYKLFRVKIKRIETEQIIVELYDYAFHDDLHEEEMEHCKNVHRWEGWDEGLHEIRREYFLQAYIKDYSQI